MSKQINVFLNGDEYRKLLEESGITTNTEFAKRIGISRVHLAQVLSRSKSIGMDTARRLYEEFGVDFPSDPLYEVEDKDLI